MTEEMASAMINSYSKFMELADKAYDAGNMTAFDKWIVSANAIDALANEFKLTFRKTWHGEYVLVEI